MIKVERNGDEFCWRNESKKWWDITRKKELRMKVNLTAD
jgi:hypothetical protein